MGRQLYFHSKSLLKHFALMSENKSESESYSVVSDSLRPHGLYRIPYTWNSPGQNTGVGSLSLLQGIFPTQGSNLGLPRCGRILYQLSHTGSPGVLEWVAYLFSSGSSQPRNWTRVSCTCRRILYQLRYEGSPCLGERELEKNSGISYFFF